VPEMDRAKRTSNNKQEQKNKTYWCLVENGWDWGNGMIITSEYGSFPHSLLSTSKKNKNKNANKNKNTTNRDNNNKNNNNRNNNNKNKNINRNKNKAVLG